LAATVIGCAGDGGPTTQPAGLTFASVSSGAEHACGLTMNGAAYCWGYNGWGQLGNGTTEDGQRPVAVAGGLHFTALTAGYMHNCGVTASSATGRPPGARSPWPSPEALRSPPSAPVGSTRAMRAPSPRAGRRIAGGRADTESWASARATSAWCPCP